MGQVTEQVNVRFTRAEVDALQAICAATNRRVADVLRRLVREELARLQADRTITLSTRQ